VKLPFGGSTPAQINRINLNVVVMCRGEDENGAIDPYTALSAVVYMNILSSHF